MNETVLGLDNAEAACEWHVRINVTKGDIPKDLQRFMTLRATEAAIKAAEAYWDRDLKKYVWP